MQLMTGGVDPVCRGGVSVHTGWCGEMDKAGARQAGKFSRDCAEDGIKCQYTILLLVIASHTLQLEEAVESIERGESVYV